VVDADEYAAKRAMLSGDATSGPAPVSVRRRSTAAAMLAIALLLPAGAIALYRLVGAPQALDPAALANHAAGAPGDHGPDMQEAIAKLAAKLRQQPDDVAGWGLLGRAYQATGHFDEARDAFKHAFDLAADNPDVMVEYAQSLALATPDRHIDGEARALIDRALKADPGNQRGLWLLGISEYQAGHDEPAIAAWNRLLAGLPADSDMRAGVQQQIDEARARAGGGATAAPSGPASATDGATPVAPGPRLTVQVALDPALAARVAPDDALFVFARAAGGPPMPLAVQRLTAGKLPTTVTLDDSMGMLPTMKLSMFPQVVVGARISRSGNAIPQSGDLQALSAPLDVGTTAPIALKIDQAVP
jgi:cytochrome c-type biogenesis protein CcmH